MDKILKPSPAVLAFNRVETTYNRATSQKLDRKQLDFWIAYYQRRIQEIADVYKVDVDDLIVQWLQWRAEAKSQLNN